VQNIQDITTLYCLYACLNTNRWAWEQHSRERMGTSISKKFY